MVVQIQNTYYVGKNQPYETINQAINSIWSALESNNYILPSTNLPDGGNINIVIKGGGKFSGFVIPNNMTVPLKEAGRYLIIKRQEATEDGHLITDNLPVITPSALNGSEITEEDKLIGINIGSNNPNIKIIGIRVTDFVIGVLAEFNSNNLYIDRCFITNNINAQIYVHDTDKLYITNNIVVGGQYGIVAKYIRNLRLYHNTVYLDGYTALDSTTKAGILLQGERTFNNASPSTIYCLANLVYTIGCPAAIYYDEDLKNNRLISNYNNFYSQTALVQLRQDNAQLPEDTEEIVRANYATLPRWRVAGPLGSSQTLFIDANSISVHPVFIQSVSLLSSSFTSIINLNAIDNSPLLSKVPSWYFANDSFYIPSDLDSQSISKDCLLNTRQQPTTSIGANDKKSLNGFFGQDIFTNPLLLDPEKKCDIDSLNIISAQEVSSFYPIIKAGYFWSHEREYYLYGKKGAFKLGYLAVTEFILPGHLNEKKTIDIKVKGVLLTSNDWNLIGNKLYIYHHDNGITSYEDEVSIQGSIKFWHNNGFSNNNVFYLFKIKDGITRFFLPEDYKPGAPVVITDDRISYINNDDLTRREFLVQFDSVSNKNEIIFGGNENLLTNGDFTQTINGRIPTYWIAKPQPLTGEQSVFMLHNSYSYWGDYALALRTNTKPGYVLSPTIKVTEDDSVCLSWHARLPVDITGSTGQPITGLDATYHVGFYNNYNELIPYSVQGSFTVPNTGFNRYCLSFGTSDQVLDLSNNGLNSAPLTFLSTSPISLPDNVTKLELTISGNSNSNISTGAFVILDCIQAEKSVNPSYYHPQPSFNAMTVEFETDLSGQYINNRLNISSVFNENPNGFLYIPELPATIWNGPADPEVTTLHEYRWPDGRLNILPWARLFGKDKLAQKAILSNLPNQPADIIAPYTLPRQAKDSVMTPAVVRVNQDTQFPEGFNVQVVDNFNNPYALRNYVLHVYDKNNNFPGWLSKKHYGAKEQLGSTIYGSLSSNGSVPAFYLPPDSSYVRWVGLVPKPITPISGYSPVLDELSNIVTRYNVNSENNGNITIVGNSGNYVNTNGTGIISGRYMPFTDKSTSYLVLEYPPVAGSVKVYTDAVDLIESFTSPQSFEFSVNYPYGQIQLPGGIVSGQSFTVEYLPKFAYPNPKHRNRIILHNNKLFGSYTGPIQVDYDAELFLELRVADVLNREYVSTFPIVIQNSSLSKVANQTVSFEF